MSVTIPTNSGGSVPLEPRPQHPIVVVGPNGSGKSALSAYLHPLLGPRVNRILSYRKLWLESSAPSLTGNDRISWVPTLSRWDSQLQSRWRDQNDHIRLGLLLLDLLNRQAYSDAQIARAVRSGNNPDSENLDGPLEVLNSILASSSLPIEVLVDENGGLACRGKGGVQYSAAEMSDGEKAALLLVASVLVAEPGTTHLVDEPERHIHRSISGSLITSLIERRPDDAFVIFTHDLDLAQYLGRQGSLYVCMECSWQDSKPSSWAISEVPQGLGLPDEVTRAVLGGRSRIAFHEGGAGSLDQELYEALLRGYTTVPAGNCRNVLNFVQGIRQSAGYHWLDSRGIVDKDYRNDVPPDGVVKLRQHEIENVFYTRVALEQMAQIQSTAFGENHGTLLANALAQARMELRKSGVRDNIIAKCRLAAVRNALTEEVQGITTLTTGTSYSISCTVPATEFASQYDALLADGAPDLDDFLGLFPIRESGVRSAVANALHFVNAKYYEAAVIQRARSDGDFRMKLIQAAGLDSLAVD